LESTAALTINIPAEGGAVTDMIRLLEQIRQAEAQGRPVVIMIDSDGMGASMGKLNIKRCKI
jgi:hypothetical protein